jgi:hypothetical protein
MDDLRKQYKSLKAALNDICDEDGNLKTQELPPFRRIVAMLHMTKPIGILKLWQLVAPVDLRRVPVTYTDALGYAFWRVMDGVIATFPLLTPVSSGDSELDQLWGKWARTLDQLTSVVRSQLPSDGESVCAGESHLLPAKITYGRTRLPCLDTSYWCGNWHTVVSFGSSCAVR